MRSHAKVAGAAGCPRKAFVIGVIRESMTIRARLEDRSADRRRGDEGNQDSARRQLGATLVESGDPLWTPDAEIEQMKIDYRAALARLVPVFMPDLLYRLTADGSRCFKDFAAAIVPTEFEPGKIFGSGTMKPIDYCVACGRAYRAADESRSRHRPASGAGDGVPLPYRAVSVPPRRRLEGEGFTETLADFAALNARSKFWGDDQRAAFLNWDEVTDLRNPLGRRQGVNERIMLRELLRRVDMMVILENQLDALVRLHTPWPPGLIGQAYQYNIASNLSPESLSGPNAGLTEVLIPAGYVTTVYDPVYQLSAGRHALRLQGVRHADDDCRAGLAVLAGVPRRTGQGRQSCCTSRRPTKRRRSAASRRPPSARCRWNNAPNRTSVRA